jgi:hypothetical protein
MAPPLVSAELAVNVQFVIKGEDMLPYMPPPPYAEVFPKMMQLVMEGEELSLYNPPPLVAEFPENTQLAKEG